MSHLTLVKNPEKVTVHITVVYDKHDPKYPACGYKATVQNRQVAMGSTVLEVQEKVEAMYTDADLHFVELFDEGEDL